MITKLVDTSLVLTFPLALIFHSAGSPVEKGEKCDEIGKREREREMEEEDEMLHV